MRRCSSSFGTPTRIDDFAKTRRSAAREGIVSSGSFREPSEGEAVVRRDYETADVTVHWDSTRCVHSGICLKSLPDVFDTQRRPWVDVAAASAGEIVAAIERCPSGALTYTPAAGPGEQPDVPTTVIPWPNGPLWVRGDVEVRDRSGNLFRARAPRCAVPLRSLSESAVLRHVPPHSRLSGQPTCDRPCAGRGGDAIRNRGIPRLLTGGGTSRPRKGWR